MAVVYEKPDRMVKQRKKKYVLEMLGEDGWRETSQFFNWLWVAKLFVYMREDDFTMRVATQSAR